MRGGRKMTIRRLKPCPFCGEIPLLDEKTNEVVHNCLVLKKELRVGINEWNQRTKIRNINYIKEYLNLLSVLDLRYLENEFERNDFRILPLYGKYTVPDVAQRYSRIIDFLCNMEAE